MDTNDIDLIDQGGQEWTRRERYTVLREENARLRAIVHALQPILDPAALGKDADGYRDTALALTRERDEARAEVARLREMPPPVCTGSGTVPVDAQVSYSTLPTEGRCGICGQMGPLANSTNFVLATHPFRAARGE